MKKKVRLILSLAVIAASTALLIILNIANNEQRNQLTCSGLNVEFTDSFNFVTENDIKGWIDTFYGSYVGQRLDSVKLAAIEKMLDSKSAVLKSEAYTTPDGLLNVRISQREPVVRFQKGDIGFYIDERGFIFPLQKNYSAKVPIIDGQIPVLYTDGYKGEPHNEKEARWLASVLKMVNFMKTNKIWSDNIVQMSVDGEGDLILVPREGKERFVFGYPENIEDKFSRIEKYYQYIMPEKEYSSVNVKYDNQIICK